MSLEDNPDYNNLRWVDGYTDNYSNIKALEEFNRNKMVEHVNYVLNNQEKHDFISSGTGDRGTGGRGNGGKGTVRGSSG